LKILEILFLLDFYLSKKQNNIGFVFIYDFENLELLLILDFYSRMTLNNLGYGYI